MRPVQTLSQKPLRSINVTRDTRAHPQLECHRRRASEMWRIINFTSAFRTRAYAKSWRYFASKSQRDEICKMTHIRKGATPAAAAAAEASRNRAHAGKGFARAD